MTEVLNILCLEDSPQDAEIIHELLTDAGYHLNMDCTAVEKEFVSFLRSNRYDIILADFKLPGFDGFTALRWSVEICPDVPFICISGTIGEETAVELLKKGAVDYILKDRLVRLPSAVQRALEQHRIQIEKRSAELLLKENEEKLQSIFSAAPVGIGLVVDRVFIEFNDTFCKMTGYTRAELIGKNSEMIYSTNEEYKKVGVEKYRQIADKGTGSVETSFMCKDGSVLDIFLSSTPLDKDDLTKGVTFIAMDITERKRAEEALHESEGKFKAIFQNSNDAIMLLDKNGFYECNPLTLNMFKIKEKEEFVKFRPDELSPPIQPDGRNSFEAAQKNISIAYKEGYNRFDWVHRRTDGEDFYAEVLLSAFEHGEERVLQATVRDITERKQAEENLMLSERNLADAERIGNTGSWYYNLETGLAEWSENLYHIFDVDKELQTDLVFKNYIENIIHPDDRLAVDNVYSEIFAAERLIDIEFRIFRMDGEIRFFRMRAESKSDQTGKVIQVIGRVEDTSKSKQAEEVIQKINEELNETNKELIAAKEKAEESEEKYRKLSKTLKQERILLRTIIDSIPDSIYVKDLEYRKVLANKANCQNCGVDKEEDIIGRTDFDIFPVEIAEKLLEADKKVCEDGVSVINREEYIKRPNFDEKCLLTSKLPLYDDKGKIIGLVGIGHDITERKRAEQEILDSERKLRGVFDTVGAGILIIEKESMKIIEANNTAFEMAGYKEEGFIGQVCTEVFCPAEKGQCPVRDVGQHIDNAECIMLCASGEKKEILKTVNQLILKGKEVYVESFIDITEQNIVNKKVREQLEELRRWYDVTSDREERVIELKREVNEALAEAGKPKRYENT